MVHIALVAVAVLSAGWLVLMLISLIFRGSGRTPGCMTIAAAVVIALLATMLALKF